MKRPLAVILTALLLACDAGQVKSDPFAAADGNDARSLRAYLDHGGDPNAVSLHGESLLYIATGPHGGEDVLRLLLARGANPNLGAGAYSPLMNASSWCWLKGVTLLVEAGADPKVRNEKGQTAMQTVCVGGDRDKVLAYLAGRASDEFRQVR